MVLGCCLFGSAQYAARHPTVFRCNQELLAMHSLLKSISFRAVSCSPYVLANAFYPMTQIIDVAVPFFEPKSHALNLTAF